MVFRLRYLQHNLELSAGEFLIGRSAECQLSLDDPLVSRKHARLMVTSDTVTVTDLGSRNGVLVNRVKIEQPRALVDGDCISIGSQDMSLGASVESRPDAAASRRRAATQTLSSMAGIDSAALTSSSAPASLPAPAKPDGSKRLDALSLLGSVADKALALGRLDEAERILGPVLSDILTTLKAGGIVPPETIDQVGRYAVRFAAATNKESWVDYLVKIYTHAGRPWPAPVVDELHNVLRKVKTVDVAALRVYVQLLREASGGYGPNERFLVQRIESLERLAALR